MFSRHMAMRNSRSALCHSSPSPWTPPEEIAGLVERVTFFSAESGFAVLRVNVRGQRDLVTVLGSVPTVSAGEWLTANGWWVRDKEHGLQFKATVLKAAPPTKREIVERYLGSGFVKGVGLVLAKDWSNISTRRCLGSSATTAPTWILSMASGQSAEFGSRMPGNRGCRSGRSWSSSIAAE